MADWTTPAAIHSKCGETSPNLATRAIDTDTAKDWMHYVASCYHWIIFDMGSTKTITKIRLYQYLDGVFYRWGRTSGLTVYVGDDPADFGAEVWHGVLDVDGWQESGAFSKDGRYVKLVTLYGQKYEKMFEFQAYAADVGGGVTVKKGSNLAATMTEMLNSKMLFSACNRFPKLTTRRF